MSLCSHGDINSFNIIFKLFYDIYMSVVQYSRL